MFTPDPRLSTTLDRVVGLRLGSFRDDLSKRTKALRIDESRRGLAGGAGGWKLWSGEIEELPGILQGEALPLLEEYGVALSEQVIEWLVPVLERHLDLTPGLTREAETFYPNQGFGRRIADLIQRMKARLRANLTVASQRAMLRGAGRIDSLTRLLNRDAFEQDLGEALQRAGRAGEPLALFVLDLDHFKSLNDAHGHAAGDDALRSFAERTKAALDGRGAAYRIGGDEFALVVQECGRAEAEALGVHLREAVLLTPLTPYDVALDVSLGCAIAPDDATTREALFEKADQAMYSHKKARRSAP